MESTTTDWTVGTTRLCLELAAGVHAPGASSLELAARIPDCAGKSVLDLGCGTGLFAVVAAKRGAREAWATDVSPEAAACAERNATRNGVAVRGSVGDLFEPVRGRRFDLIVTNPPQTPAPDAAWGPKFGGEDGLRFFERILREASDHLEENGRLLTMLISLADTRRFAELASERFRLENLGESERDFTREEYAGYWPGLFEFLLDRKRRGSAEFEERPGGFRFRVRYFAARPK